MRRLLHLEDGGVALRAAIPTFPRDEEADGPTWARSDVWPRCSLFHSLLLVFDRDPAPGFYLSFGEWANVVPFFRVAPGIYMECCSCPPHGLLAPAEWMEVEVCETGGATLQNYVFFAVRDFVDEAPRTLRATPIDSIVFDGIICPTYEAPLAPDISIHVPWTASSYLCKLRCARTTLRTVRAYRERRDAVRSAFPARIPRHAKSLVAAFATPPTVPFRADRLDVCDWMRCMRTATLAAAHWIRCALGASGLRDAVACGLFSAQQLRAAEVPADWLRRDADFDVRGSVVHVEVPRSGAAYQIEEYKEGKPPEIRGRLLRTRR